MVPEQMLTKQMSLWLSESVLDVPRNLPLKVGQIGSVTAEILLVLSLCNGWVAYTHFHVKPNLG